MERRNFLSTTAIASVGIVSLLTTACNNSNKTDETKSLLESDNDSSDDLFWMKQQ